LHVGCVPRRLVSSHTHFGFTAVHLGYIHSRVYAFTLLLSFGWFCTSPFKAPRVCAMDNVHLATSTCPVLVLPRPFLTFLHRFHTRCRWFTYLTLSFSGWVYIFVFTAFGFTHSRLARLRTSLRLHAVTISRLLRYHLPHYTTRFTVLLSVLSFGSHTRCRLPGSFFPVCTFPFGPFRVFGCVCCYVRFAFYRFILTRYTSCAPVLVSAFPYAFGSVHVPVYVPLHGSSRLHTTPRLLRLQFHLLGCSFHGLPRYHVWFVFAGLDRYRFWFSSVAAWHKLHFSFHVCGLYTTRFTHGFAACRRAPFWLRTSRTPSQVQTAFRFWLWFTQRYMVTDSALLHNFTILQFAGSRLRLHLDTAFGFRFSRKHCFTRFLRGCPRATHVLAFCHFHTPACGRLPRFTLRFALDLSHVYVLNAFSHTWFTVHWF